MDSLCRGGMCCIPMPIAIEEERLPLIESTAHTLKEGSFFAVRKIRQQLNISSGAALNTIFRKVANLNQYENNHGIQKHLKAIERCVDILPLLKIREALILAIDHGQDLDVHLSSAVRQFASQVGRSVGLSTYQLSRPGAIENILTALRYLSEQEVTGPFTASNVLQTYVVLVIFVFVTPGMIENIIHDYEPDYINQLSLMGMLAAFLVAGILSFKIYKSISPIPNQIKPMMNFTLAAREGNIEPLLFRDAIIDKIFKCWEVSNQEFRQHPILVGPSGAGKTGILMEIARRLNLGQVPAGLKKAMKDIKMFGGPASLFLTNSSMMESDDKLEQFLRIVGSNKDKIILALDEIHALLNEKYGTRYADILKSILDISLRGLPYFIGATTKGEYDKYISGTALERRFKKIDVHFLKEGEVKISLQNMMRHYPHVLASSADYQTIFDAGEELIHNFPHLHLSQPEISKRILGVAISMILLKQDDIPESQQLHKFRNVSQHIASCNEELITLAAKIEDIRQGQADKETFNKRFMLLFYYLLPKLRELHESLRDELRIPLLRDLMDGAKEEVLNSLGKVANKPQQGANALQQIANILQDQVNKLERLDIEQPESVLEKARTCLEEGRKAFVSIEAVPLLGQIIIALQEAARAPQEEASILQQLANAIQQASSAIEQSENALQQTKMALQQLAEKFSVHQQTFQAAVNQLQPSQFLTGVKGGLMQSASALQQVASLPQQAANALYQTANALQEVKNKLPTLAKMLLQAKEALK